ncbi:10335_t:CDS:2 [Entrophospora sp. SA101]|nr:10335_t:CDS:2 [Entrophospora sp. SA101]
MVNSTTWKCTRAANDMLGNTAITLENIPNALNSVPRENY